MTNVHLMVWNRSDTTFPAKYDIVEVRKSDREYAKSEKNKGGCYVFQIAGDFTYEEKAIYQKTFIENAGTENEYAVYKYKFDYDTHLTIEQKTALAQKQWVIFTINEGNIEDKEN